MALVFDQMPAGSLRVYKATDGSWHAKAISLAEGIMEYDGGRRQLITREAVLSAGELDGRSVITLGHPAEEVTPENYRTYTAGDAGKTYVKQGKGGFSECEIDVAIRAADALGHAERGELTGLSRGHTPIIVDEAGEHPVFGRYTEKRIGHVGDTNHIALCGNTDTLPPPRGPGCGIYLDSMPVPPAKEPTMIPIKDRVKAAFDAIAKATDAVSYDKAVAMLKELASDPDGLLLIKAYAEKGGKEDKPKEEPPPEAPPADPMAAMDAKIKAALDARTATLRTELDAVKARLATRDAADAALAAKLEQDANAEIITLARRHGALDGVTKDAAITHLRGKFPAARSDQGAIDIARHMDSLPAVRLPILDAGFSADADTIQQEA